MNRMGLPTHTPKNTSIVKAKKKNLRLKLKYNFSSGTSLSDLTYSTSAIANVKTKNSNTEDTLSMISSPWSTDYNSYASSFSNPLPMGLRESSESALPMSTTTIEVPSVPSPNLSIKTTVTLYNVPSIPSEPESVYHFPKRKRRPGSADTLSSWSIETFTSNGLLSESVKLKPKYPWSPCTQFSETDIYPSSETMVSRKGSLESSRGFGSVASGDKLVPMNYAKEINSEEKFIMDTILIKAKGLPIVWHYD